MKNRNLVIVGILFILVGCISLRTGREKRAIACVQEIRHMNLSIGSNELKPVENPAAKLTTYTIRNILPVNKIF